MHIKHNIELQNYNSFRTKAKAKLFCAPTSIQELKEVLKKYQDEQKLIIGNGNNLFFTKNFDGLVIKPMMKGIDIVQDFDNEVIVQVSAAEEWDDFVAYCVENGYSGVENLSLIPGTVGAAPVQNIGAYGAEVKDVVSAVKAVEIETGKVVEFANESCQFAYRDSIFKQTRNYIIAYVTFRLSKKFTYNDKYADLNQALATVSAPTIAQVRQAVIEIRNKKLPDCNQLPNAGSFFKNPILNQNIKDSLLHKLPQAPIYPLKNNLFKTSAAYLISKATDKGKRIGLVGIYEHHSLILVNYGTEKGTDIVQFMETIQAIVFDKFNIMLEPEVQIY